MNSFSSMNNASNESDLTYWKGKHRSFLSSKIFIKMTYYRSFKLTPTTNLIYFECFMRPMMKLVFPYGIAWNICDFNAIIWVIKQSYFIFVLGDQGSGNTTYTFVWFGMFENRNYKRSVVEEFCIGSTGKGS